MTGKKSVLSKQLTPKKQIAIAALTAGESQETAAALAGVTVKTLRRWQKEPVFTTGLNAADHDFLKDTARQLNQAAGDAMRVLVGVLNDASSNQALKLRAADLILTHRVKFFELLNLSERLAVVEAAIQFDYYEAAEPGAEVAPFPTLSGSIPEGVRPSGQGI